MSNLKHLDLAGLYLAHNDCLGQIKFWRAKKAKAKTVKYQDKCASHVSGQLERLKWIRLYIRRRKERQQATGVAQ